VSLLRFLASLLFAIPNIFKLIKAGMKAFYGFKNKKRITRAKKASNSGDTQALEQEISEEESFSKAPTGKGRVRNRKS